MGVWIVIVKILWLGVGVVLGAALLYVGGVLYFVKTWKG